MKKHQIMKWSLHLIGATCIAGTIALLITFCSEVLFRDRGVLDRSLMTWEDVYGPVITSLLAIGLLLIPLRSFSFRSWRVWLGASVTAAALTAVAYVLAAPVELSHFHSDNFIMAIGMLSFVGFLCAFAGRYGSSQNAGNRVTDPTVPRPGSKLNPC